MLSKPACQPRSLAYRREERTQADTMATQEPPPRSSKMQKEVRLYIRKGIFHSAPGSLSHNLRYEAL